MALDPPPQALSLTASSASSTLRKGDEDNRGFWLVPSCQGGIDERSLRVGQ